MASQRCVVREQLEAKPGTQRRIRSTLAIRPSLTRDDRRGCHLVATAHATVVLGVQERGETRRSVRAGGEWLRQFLHRSFQR